MRRFHLGRSGGGVLQHGPHARRWSGRFGLRSHRHTGLGRLYCVCSNRVMDWLLPNFVILSILAHPLNHIVCNWAALSSGVGHDMQVAYVNAFLSVVNCARQTTIRHI